MRMKSLVGWMVEAQRVRHRWLSLGIEQSVSFHDILRIMIEVESTDAERPGVDSVHSTRSTQRSARALDTKSLVAHYYQWKHTEAHSRWLLSNDKVRLLPMAVRAAGSVC